MSFFRETVSMEVRLSPEEVERRLRRVVRKPRTFVEVLRRTPVNPPEHPDFVGDVGNGRFTVGRLADEPAGPGRFQHERPRCRGVITATDTGAAIQIEFFDQGLATLVVGLSVGMSAVVLLVTRGWPIWRLEHLLIVGVVSVSAWAYRYSLREDVVASTALIERCLKRQA